MNRDIQNAQRDRNLKLCQHEASHTVCAFKLGFEVVSCEIKQVDFLLQGGAKLNLFRPISDISETVIYLNDRITVLLAGMIGEHFIEREYEKDDADGFFKSLEGRSDDDKIRELRNLLMILSPITAENYLEQLDQLENRLRLQTVDLVRKNRRAIYRLRDEMMARVDQKRSSVKLNHNDILRCIEEAEK